MLHTDLLDRIDATLDRIDARLRRMHHRVRWGGVVLIVLELLILFLVCSVR